jgi:hypothetical protein
MKHGFARKVQRSYDPWSYVRRRKGWLATYRAAKKKAKRKLDKLLRKDYA